MRLTANDLTSEIFITALFALSRASQQPAPLPAEFSGDTQSIEPPSPQPSAETALHGAIKAKSGGNNELRNERNPLPT